MEERIDEVNDNIRLIQLKDGLTFGTDALLLAAYVKSDTKANMAELGGGTGIISLLLAQRNKAKHIDCIEVQDVFCDIIDRNIKENGLDNKISGVCADVREIKNKLTLHSYDAVFLNPPYLPNGKGKSNESVYKHIARHEECGTINDFVKAAADLLKFGGKFYAVYRPNRLCELFSALKENNLSPKKMTLVCASANSKPSMVLIMATSGGKDGIDVTEPLILYKDNTKEFTERTAYIYKCGNFKNLWDL